MKKNKKKVTRKKAEVSKRIKSNEQRNGCIALKTEEELRDKARHIRNLILDMCVKAGTGHVNSSFSAVEVLVALFYGGILRYDPKNPKWKDRDRFILSKGQASVILYPILANLGFFPDERLSKFNAADGSFGVHLQHDVPGAEITSGSLGHGFGIAAGIAKAAKMNRELQMVFTLLGDGECYEGSIWETAMFASHHRLNNLVAIIDRNHLCATNFTEEIVALEPLDKKFEAFGWRVVNINGHSFNEIFSALRGYRSRKYTKPLLIIADTTKGKGISFMSDVPLWHSIPPKEGKEAELARAEVNREEII